MPFEKGRAKTGGRAAGTPNKHTQEVKNALREALETSHNDGATGYFLEVARDDPRTFMAAVGKLIPTAIESTHEVKNTITVRKYSGGRERERKEKRTKSKEDAS